MTSGSDGTTLGFDRSARLVLFAVGGLVGLGLGIALPYAAGLLASFDWIPFGGLLRDVADVDATWAAIARPVVGVLLGLGFAAYVVHDSPVVRVEQERILITQRGSTRVVERAVVSGVYRDGSRIVVVSQTGRELFRGDIEGGRENVRAAFVDHGYPWESL